MLDDSITEVNKKSQWVKIYPEIILAAARNKNAGAVRLWELAKYEDQPNGYGLISSQAFRHFIINDLKWKLGTFDRYLNQAEYLGIIERRGDYYRLVAPAITALVVGCKHVGAPEMIKLKKFAGKCWLAYTYAAFMKRFNGQIMSAKTIQKLTGIPIRTIYHYDRLLGKGIRKRHNYARHEGVKSKENIWDVGVEKGRHLFENKNSGKILERLPNKRFIFSTIARPPKHTDNQGKTVNTIRGQKDKINSALNAILNTLNYPEGSQKVHLKSYIDNEKLADRKETERGLMAILKKKALHGERISQFIYRFDCVIRGTGFYEAI